MSARRPRRGRSSHGPHPLAKSSRNGFYSPVNATQTHVWARRRLRRTERLRRVYGGSVRHPVRTGTKAISSVPPRCPGVSSEASSTERTSSAPLPVVVISLITVSRRYIRIVRDNRSNCQVVYQFYLPKMRITIQDKAPPKSFPGALNACNNNSFEGQPFAGTCSPLYLRHLISAGSKLSKRYGSGVSKAKVYSAGSIATSLRSRMAWFPLKAVTAASNPTI